MGDIISASGLARQTHVGITLPGAYGDVFGAPAPNFTALVWGPKGGGKSTFVLGLADQWARHVAPVLYVSAEESHGAAFAARIRRMGATANGLHIATFSPEAGLSGILDDLRATGAGLVVIDSISWIDPKSTAFGEFALMLQQAGVALVYIAHATKSGGSYLGSTRVGHAVDAVVKVAGGHAEAEKNRYATDRASGSAAVPFEKRRANPAPSCSCRQCTSCGGTVRTNPPHSGACAYAKGSTCECRCGGRLHSSTITRVKGAAKTAGRQTAQGRAVMASLTKSGKKKVRPAPKKRTSATAASKAAPRKTTARSSPSKKRTGARPKGGVAAQLAALRKQIGTL